MSALRKLMQNAVAEALYKRPFKSVQLTVRNLILSAVLSKPIGAPLLAFPFESNLVYIPLVLAGRLIVSSLTRI